jgi:FAD/FMN-containing dehydrogenase
MSDILSLQQVFKGDIVTSSDCDYDAAISRWAPNAERKAKIVAFVKDAEDVSAAITFAKASKLLLAIRGGGHSCSGASSIQDGIVIDLSRYLKGVRIDAENKLAYADGGAVWSTVDKTAIEHGLATVGGTVNHVIDFVFRFCCETLLFIRYHLQTGVGGLAFSCD